MAIKYGFFNAIKNSEGVYDRRYEASDLNNFLKGLIGQNGVFPNVGNHCEVDYLSGVTVNSDYSSVFSNGKIVLRVKPGKAMVNGCWVDIDSEYLVELNAPKQSGTRYDTICIQWNYINRTCSIVTHEYDSLIDAIPTGWTESGFPTTNIVEIMLAIITVPEVSQTVVRKAGDIIIDSQIGKMYCPYISHLVIGPDATDVDKTLANYYARFDKWFKDTTDAENITETLIVKHYYKSLTTDLTAHISLASVFTSYTFNSADIFKVCMNGLELTRDVDWSLSIENNIPYINLINLATVDSLANQSLTIEIIPASLFGMSDGDVTMF